MKNKNSFWENGISNDQFMINLQHSGSKASGLCILNPRIDLRITPMLSIQTSWTVHLRSCIIQLWHEPEPVSGLSVWSGLPHNHPINLCVYVLDTFSDFFTPRIPCSTRHCLQVSLVLGGTSTLTPGVRNGCSHEEDKRTCCYCFHKNSPYPIIKIAKAQQSQQISACHCKRQRA